MSKIIFNNLLQNNYKIKKENNELLFIFYINKDNNSFNEYNKIKCKYYHIITQKNITIDTSLIIWNDSNPYNDNITKEISKYLRNILLLKKKYLINCNNQLIFNNDLKNLINTIIKDNIEFTIKNNIINCIWIISNKLKDSNNLNDVIEYYLITEIIYY